jgi:hypothetical protein
VVVAGAVAVGLALKVVALNLLLLRMAVAVVAAVLDLMEELAVLEVQVITPHPAVWVVRELVRQVALVVLEDLLLSEPVVPAVRAVVEAVAVRLGLPVLLVATLEVVVAQRVIILLEIHL